MTFANTVKLGKFGGIFCLMSEAWALGKTLLWPLCKLLSSYREYDTGGKLRCHKAQAKLSSDGKVLIMEWYVRINTLGICKKFYTFRGSFDWDFGVGGHENILGWKKIIER